MILAAIDLGSNTVKTTLARLADDGGLEVLAQRAVMTRIGEKLDQTGSLLPEAMERTERALSGFVELFEEHGVERTRCVATAGMRGAANADVFIDGVAQRLGLSIQIIHGLREAALTFRAPAQLFGPGRVTVVDIGGRSTELVGGTTADVDVRQSLEIGGVRLTERFLDKDPPDEPSLARMVSAIRTSLGAQQWPAPGRLVGVSGTIISLLGHARGVDNIEEVLSRFEGDELSARDVSASLDSLRRVPASQRIFGTTIPPGRADVIVAGAAILLEVMSTLNVSEITVSQRGVRYGLLLEMADESTKTSV